MANLLANNLFIHKDKDDQLFAVLGTLWIVITWFFINVVVLSAVVYGLVQSGIPIQSIIASDNFFVQVAINFSYAPLLIGLTWIVYNRYLKRKNTTFRQLLGIERGPRWSDLIPVIPAFIGYFLLSTTVLIIVSMLAPSADLDQAQELGIQPPTALIEYIAIFVLLVVIPPLIEEFLFRGLLFGTLSRGFSLIIATIVTSIFFGLAHGQLNLFLDTLVLSLFLCYLRIRTGNIWSSILLHATKNCLAFVLLYVVKIQIG